MVNALKMLKRTTPTGPLAGVTIVSLEQWAALPGATAIMSDWGAEVVKLESVAGGDGTRGIAALGRQQVQTRLNPQWELLNRNKKSVAVDLRQPRGKEVVHRLVEQCDVFSCGFTEDTRKKLGIDYRTLSRINPRLVYLSFTGYGERGAERLKRGYDVGAFWARSGIMATMGEPDAPPVPEARGIGDHTAAVHIAATVSAALFSRERTGKGQEVNVSLYQCGIWTNSCNLQEAVLSHQEIARLSRKSAGNPLYAAYEAKDGKWFQLMLLQTDRYWSAFCRSIGANFERDARFDTHEMRIANRAELIAILDAVIAGKTRDEWAELFDQNSILWDPIETPTEVIANPQAWANDLFVNVDDPRGDTLTLVNSPGTFHGTPSAIRAPAPQLGEHTEEVLLGAGYTWEDIAALKETRVIL